MPFVHTDDVDVAGLESLRSEQRCHQDLRFIVGFRPRRLFWQVRGYSLPLQLDLAEQLIQLQISFMGYLLCKAQKDQDSSGSTERWTDYYANLMLAETQA